MWGALAAIVLSFTVSPGVNRNVLNVPSSENTTLEATEYRYQQQQRETLILTGDGWEGAKTPFIDQTAEALFLRGFDVVIWDKRGTGDSTGKYDFGHSDAEDLARVLAAVAKRTGRHGIGMLALGSGGVAAFKVTAKTSKVQALAVYDTGIYGAPFPETGLSAWMNNPEHSTSKWFFKLRGIEVDENAPPYQDEDLRLLVSNLHHTPLLVSAGGRSSRIDPVAARQLYEAANAPKQWLYAPWSADEPPVSEWAPQLEDFFRRYLHSSPD